MNLEVTETEVRLIKKLLKKHLLHVKTEISLTKIFDLQNKLNKLTIPVVVKSFYCWNEDCGLEPCEEICKECSKYKGNNP